MTINIYVFSHNCSTELVVLASSKEEAIAKAKAWEAKPENSFHEGLAELEPELHTGDIALLC